MENNVNGIITDYLGQKKGLVINGRLLLAPVYDDVYLFASKEYKPKCWQPSCYFLHDKNGYGLFIIHSATMYEYKINPQYDSISFICQINDCAYFEAKKGNESALLSNYEHFYRESCVGDNLYDKIEFAFNHGFKVYREDKIGYIDSYGRMKLQVIYDNIDAVFNDSFIANGIWLTYEGKIIFKLENNYFFFGFQTCCYVFKLGNEDKYKFFDTKKKEIVPIGETSTYIVLDDSYRFNKIEKIIEERDNFYRGSYQEEYDQMQYDIEIGTKDYYNCDPEAQWNTD